MAALQAALLKRHARATTGLVAGWSGPVEHGKRIESAPLQNREDAAAEMSHPVVQSDAGRGNVGRYGLKAPAPIVIGEASAGDDQDASGRVRKASVDETSRDALAARRGLDDEAPQLA